MPINFTNTIIYLMGFAGTGKLTIAGEIIKQANFRLVDNHLINNPILNLVRVDSKTDLPDSVWEKTAIIRDAVLSAMVEIVPKEYNFVFTNELIDGDSDCQIIYNKIEEMAKLRGSVFVPVRLICEQEELCRRVVSPSRISFGKTTNVDKAKHKSSNMQVFLPDNKKTLRLDVTNLTASQAAEVILESVYSA